MKNISNNELDDLFRNLVNDDRLEFNHKHWRDLEGRLDRYYSKKAHTRKVVYIFLCLIFTVLTVLTPEKLNLYEPIGLKHLNKESEIKKSRGPYDNSEKYESFFYKIFENSDNKIFDNNRKAFSKKLNEVDKKQVMKSLSLPLSLSNNIVGLPLLYKLRSKSYSFTNSDFGLVVPNIEEQQSKGHSDKESRIEHDNNYRNSLKLSVLISPDLSASSGIGKINSGFNTGIVLQYFLFKNLSITTGVLKSRKVYNEKPENYSKGYGASKGPINIVGDCSITDIPINIRFFYPTNYRFKTFMSVGLSSYLMRREDYTYQYLNYEKTYNYRKQNNHLFSVVNLSIGAEYQLGKNFSLGIEPFLKVPTVGVGAGKIKLRTVGAFLSLNYNILKRDINQ
jgi:hypothetical protein